MYTKAQLVSFANYVLSEERRAGFQNPEAANQVGDWDLKNWEAMQDAPEEQPYKIHLVKTEDGKQFFIRFTGGTRKIANTEPYTRKEKALKAIGIVAKCYGIEWNGEFWDHTFYKDGTPFHHVPPVV